ncbi:MAG: hypothetical protein QXH42_10025 [Thermoplasmata archaeon]
MYDMPGTTLTRYAYTQTTTLPQGCSSITVLFNSGNPIELKTPDNREIYIKTGSTDYIYIHGSGDSYFEYQETGGARGMVELQHGPVLHPPVFPDSYLYQVADIKTGAGAQNEPEMDNSGAHRDRASFPGASRRRGRG